MGIGTYNIKSLNYGKNDLKSFNKDIIDLKLDIICLQEVDKNSLRSGNFDMLKIMANSSGYCYYYFLSYHVDFKWLLWFGNLK